MSKKEEMSASVLAFERKLDPSDGFFYSGKWSDKKEVDSWSKIPLREKQVRGTISNRMKKDKKTGKIDPAKLDAEVEKANLQKVDIASLPYDEDTLKVVFTLRIMGGFGRPSACNNPEYMAKLEKITSAYIAEQGLGEIAGRYAYNIASGRFLWRNRVGIEEAEVIVEKIEKGKNSKKWTFFPLSFPLESFCSDNQEYKELADVVAEGLGDEKNFVLLRITSYVRFGEGQEVFPSQELSIDTSTGKGDKSKFLYEVGGTAGMHSQKIGNALRTIDTWYPNYEEKGFGPIAVEPYGSVTSMGSAFRSSMHFYDILDKWMEKDVVPEMEQQHYVMATFVRGGVFGKSSKE